MRLGTCSRALLKKQTMQTIEDAVRISNAICRLHHNFVSSLVHSDLLVIEISKRFASRPALMGKKNREAISSVWVSPVAMSNEQASAVHILGGAGGLAANLRAQILCRGISGVSAFREGVRTAAGPGSKGEIDQEAFCASAHRAGVRLTVSAFALVTGFVDAPFTSA